MPFFDGMLESVTTIQNTATGEWEATVLFSEGPAFDKGIWVWNAITQLACTFSKVGNSAWVARKISPNFLRPGNGDWFVIAPDLR